MFEIVTVKEIQNIKERLEKEKKARHVLPGRYDELKALINFLSLWLEWQKYRRKEYYRKEEIKNKIKIKEENQLKESSNKKGGESNNGNG